MSRRQPGLTKVQIRRKATLKTKATLKRKARIKRRVSPEILELRDLLRQYVLARDNFQCRKCGGRQRPGNPGTVLQAAHIYPKGKHRALEYDPDNVLTLCMKDHLYWWHKNPVEAAAWAAQTVSPAAWARLQLAVATPGKKPDPGVVKLWLQQQIAKLV